MRNRLFVLLLLICIFPLSFAQAPDRQQYIRTEAPVIVVKDGKIQSVESCLNS